MSRDILNENFWLSEELSAVVDQLVSGAKHIPGDEVAHRLTGSMTKRTPIWDEALRY